MAAKKTNLQYLAVIIAIFIIAFVILYGGTSTTKFSATGSAPSKTIYPTKTTVAKPLVAKQTTIAQCAPSGPEVCDGKDNDCNGQADDGLLTYDYNRDYDYDTYGDAIAPAIVTSCYSTPPKGSSLTKDDCNDAVAAIHPGATEICGNNIDDNCNGLFDETCETCDGTDNDNNGITDDGAVCNNANNCGAFQKTCPSSQQCVYNSSENKYYCQDIPTGGGGGGY